MERGPTGRVLVVDDDDALRTVLVSLLSQAGIDAEPACSGAEALRRFAATAFDLVLTDLRMPRMDGLALLRELKLRCAEVPVIVLTAHGSVPVAVEAMKAGAADFMTKPFDRDEVVFTVRKALIAGARTAAAPPKLADDGAELLGNSAAMQECLSLVRRAAGTMATVLLRGESGTGKELAARTIHRLSPRSHGPFVPVSCAALPDQLLESELFGYDKGAFTGATSPKPGRVAIAQRGTLFLDEIGDVSAAVQVKLLRLLQEKEFQPLGATRCEKADVRFVAATHRDLEDMVARGTFREDLFYRLDVLPIWLPPLRARPGDVAELAHTFCEALARANHRSGLRLSPSAIDRLSERTWPGNVRELQNFLERLVVFADANLIDEPDVAREIERSRRRGASSPGAPSLPGDGPTSLAETRSEAEREAVAEALARADGNRTQAARLLGISRRTLYNRLSALDVPDERLPGLGR